MKLAQAVAVATLIGLFLSGLVALDARHAAAADLQLVAERLDNKIIGDQIYQIEQRIWRARQELDREPNNNFLRREIQRLQSDLKRLEREQATITR